MVDRNYLPKIMKLCVVFFIVTLVTSSKVHYDDGLDDSSASGESMSYIPHVETTLDFRGRVRKLFILELGLNLNEDNIICSPISALMPLAKLVFGSKRKSRTETELFDAIGLKRRTEVKYEFIKIIKDLEYLKGVDISLVSRLYVSNKFSLMPRFVSKVQSIFGSGIEVMDVSHPKDAAARINNWIRVNTGNKIKDVIKPSDITPMVSLILANAIHFKGAWEYPFHPAGKEVFHSPDGPIRVDMMTRSESYNYIKCDELNAQVVEIPYKGGESAMVIVLPYAKNGLPILLRTLKMSPSILNNALMRMKTALVDITMPKFKIETTIDLVKFYKKMGIKNSMDLHKSDIVNIVRGEKLYISSAIHKAVIEVSEKGTVAAAATGSNLMMVSKIIAPNTIKVNCPFLFYIKANHDQLFGGIVNSPW